MSGTWADAGLRVVWTDFPEVVDPAFTLRANCVAYWKMDEASGTRIDATGRGNDLIDVGGNINSATGKIGNASVFTSTAGQRLQRTSNADLEMMGHDYYIAFWVKVNALSTVRFVCRFDINEEEFAVELDYTGIVDFSLGNNGYVEATTFGVISTGIWYFIEAYYKSFDDSYGLAINNGNFDTGIVADLYATTVPFSVGNMDKNISLSLDGEIDELYIGHFVLTQGERDYLYNSGNGRTLYP